MKVIGRTGGIGMGESTASAAFRRPRVPVFDTDAVVHRLQAPNGRVLRAIGAAFRGAPWRTTGWAVPPCAPP